MRSWEQLSKHEQNACIYSDMFKDTYGFRPRYDHSDWDDARWEAEFDSLSRAFDREQEYEMQQQNAAWEDFLNRVNSTMQIVYNCTPYRAVQIIADAEGISKQDLKWYGWEILEYRLGIKFDNIKNWLKTKEI